MKENILRLIEKPITLESFDMGSFSNLRCGYQYTKVVREYWLDIIAICEDLRQKYLRSRDESYLKELLRVLPGSFKERGCLSGDLSFDKYLDLIHSMKCCMNCGRRKNCRIWHMACNLSLNDTVDYGCVCSNKWTMDEGPREIAGEIFDDILEQASR